MYTTGLPGTIRRPQSHVTTNQSYLDLFYAPLGPAPFSFSWTISVRSSLRRRRVSGYKHAGVNMRGEDSHTEVHVSSHSSFRLCAFFLTLLSVVRRPDEQTRLHYCLSMPQFAAMEIMLLLNPPCSVARDTGVLEENIWTYNNHCILLVS